MIQKENWLIVRATTMNTLCRILNIILVKYKMNLGLGQEEKKLLKVFLSTHLLFHKLCNLGDIELVVFSWTGLDIEIWKDSFSYHKTHNN